ncbi:MAG: valine--tRNA ligase [Gemmatimonadota bacterium]|nr:valine--tRNA ligase [Gemmatimonadota bacterium]
MTSNPTDELPARYEPSATEPAIYGAWIEAGCFTAQANRSARVGGDREPFTIVMPPPNVTDILHLGHGLDNVIQDVLIRWARMRSAEALWAPGTDHAGIATQNVVERLLAKEGKTRFDVGRDAFVRRTESFVAETGGTILRQLRAIGASADWTRTAYTLSPELSRAVREAFVRLYEAGLIYKGHRVIHWCPRCLTSLSDEEAEFHDESGTLYHVAYPVAGRTGRKLVVATTRPETMLGDVAVAVHPADERYRDLVGGSVLLPLVGVEIPIVADDYADPAFGTGVVKITPGHDANDFEVGMRHNLPMPVVIDADARMAEVSDAAGRVPEELRGLDRFNARQRIGQMLRESGALVKTETHQHAVRRCYRCSTVVEPRLSDQWFVRMSPLAKPALEAVRTGAIRILPERWEAVYVHWLENIRDWNISRQLWWGHRIPVWYCEACDPPNSVIVSRDDVTECPHCGGAARQDEDVLDTWFSSWLWPLSTLGWPNEASEDLKAFYPTDVLVSGPDILFFWVARMIMSGYFFGGRAPYHTVYLHGIARDTEHRKMSKSLGNGIDPLVVVKLYGADALRWTLVSGMGLGADVILDPKQLDKSFATGRNFATKLWNVGRFLLANVGSEPARALGEIDRSRLTRADHWILARLDAAIAEADAALGPLRPRTPSAAPDGRVWRDDERRVGMRLSDLAETARHFVWNELADWYVEAIKGRLAPDGEDREIARAVLVHVFDGALRLLHPIVPFITEALWQRLPGRAAGEFLVRAPWPTATDAADSRSAAAFDLVRELVVACRQIRADYNLPPGKSIDAVIVAAAAAARVYEAEASTIGRLARASVRVVDRSPTEVAAHAVLSGGSALAVPLAGLIDVEKECGKLQQELAALERQLVALEGRLADEKFIARAPGHVVEAERSKLEEWTTRRRQLSDKVRTLCGG